MTIQQPCCDNWAKAHEDGTDNEGYASLIYYDHDERVIIGNDLPAVNFCPWCGAKKDA